MKRHVATLPLPPEGTMERCNRETQQRGTAERYKAKAHITYLIQAINPSLAVVKGRSTNGWEARS